MNKQIKHMNKVQEKEVTEKILAIVNEYNLSPYQLYGILVKMSMPMSQRAFRIPEEKRLKHCLSIEMTEYILSIPDYKTYRACQLRDMVLEKFPNSGYSDLKIYRACHYLINRERYIALSQKWNTEHHERRLELTKKNNTKRTALFKEAIVKQQKEIKANG